MILNSLFELWKPSQMEQVLENFAGGTQVTASGLKGSSRSVALLQLQRQLNLPVVLLTSSQERAEDYLSDFEFLIPLLMAGEKKTTTPYFASPDTEPYQGISLHPQISTSRMQALWSLSSGLARLVIVPIRAALPYLSPPENFRSRYFNLDWGSERSPAKIGEVLRSYGYKEKDLVTSRGEYSLRGGILDVFSPAEDLPVRLEFFGDTIESMRSFDTATQRSIGERETMTVLALKEIGITPTEKACWGDICNRRWRGDFYYQEMADKTEELLEYGYFEGYEEFVSAFFPEPATLMDYLPRESCIVLDDPTTLEESMAAFRQDYHRRFDQVRETYRVAMQPEEILIPEDRWNESISRFYQLKLTDLTPVQESNDIIFDFALQSARQYHGQIQEIVNDVLRMGENGFTSFFVIPTHGKAERLSEIFSEYDSPALFFQDPNETSDFVEGRIHICMGNLRHGFRDPERRMALFTEDDLFGESRPQDRITTRRKAGAFLSDLRDLKIHDYVVHMDHGIGQFLGLTSITMEGRQREFLILKFAEEDKLYVPVERLDLVQKYMGASDVSPKLDKLGSQLWQKAKSRARASMKEMAEQLLQLYAIRKTVRGFSFPADDAMLREFEDAFEYQETPHQIAAIEDVKEDMESEKPADRLICGDVGYGKTEVAMRAAFKAISAGKQVAVLAPTTILAFQHSHTFRKRFEMFPVTIEMISRFQSRAEIKNILQQTAEGKVDILIGTHRLLSRDVLFRDLGLMIVDEEQRFGVAHKERLKEIKKNVDAITLTATPIPRTLQMALMGFRPMSVIETPPKDRLAIQTNIVKYSEDTIASAIRAEWKRGGQVYFVHNRVETIHSIAGMIRRLVPEVRVVVAHGQMNETDLEKAMLQFMNHEFDVLVSTTIIENGIDIPLVNTLIVNRADRFGLSQLYQLRGRVGRSHRRAYAYFLIPSEKELTPLARKRLSALREFTELGSGFRLAALDLEIRGAGNLLGAEQHGHIAALGFELYCRMLEQTVREMQGDQTTSDFTANLNLNLEIRIPEDYIPDMNQRLNLYKRVASVHSEEQIRDIREEIQDRFGIIPEAVENLLRFGLAKSRAEILHIRSIDRSHNTLFLQLSENGKVSPQAILSFVKRHPGSSLSPTGMLAYHGENLHQPEILFQTIEELLHQLQEE